MFHISDCKKYTRCPRLYFLDKNTKKEYHPFVRLDEKITDLAIQKLQLNTYFLGHVGDQKEKAIDAMEEYEWLVKARFEYYNLRVKVPFLHKTKKGWDIYFLYNGIYPHSNDIAFYADMVWVLENNGISINAMYMIHLNANYVRQETLNPSELFVITDCFYNTNNHPTQPIKQTIYDHFKDLRPLLDEMQNASLEHLEQPKRTNICTGRNKCVYYNTCFPQEEYIPNNSILTLIASSKKYEMLMQGKQFLKDVDFEAIEGSRQQYAQIMADQLDGLFVDQYALKSWLSHIQFPITFLDFEWERFSIPPYIGMKPYDVLPFEYAVYIMYADGSIEHKIYLNIHDDRRDLAKNLIKDIPVSGSVVAYNAEGAEKVRIHELANFFPDLKDDLLHINARMEDLQLPFISGIVYDTKMKGQWSLKSIMNMMDDPGYHSLDIQQGMDAVFQWRHLDYNREVDEAEKEKIITDLKKYCGMDAYAMTVVYRWLLDLQEE